MFRGIQTLTVGRSCAVLVEKATRTFETQGGRKKFPVGEREERILYHHLH